MRKSKKNLLAGLSAMMLLLSACGKDEQTAGKVEAEKKPKAEETKPETKVEPEEANTEISETEVLNPFIAEETEGNVDVVYTNKEANYTHDMDGVKVTVHGYQIVKVTDMNESAKTLFDDQLNGYVVSAKMTLENNTDKTMYYNNSHKIQLSNEYDVIPSNWTFLVDEKDRIISKKEKDFGKFAAGEKITGLMNFVLTDDQFESMKTVKPKYIIEGGAADNEEYKDGFRANSPAYHFIYNDEQKAQVANEKEFYQDRLTTDNIADKKMIFEKKDVNLTENIKDVKVTVDGVQYTEVIPTAANVERFSDFKDRGIVALTVKLVIDNKSKEELNLASMVSTLRIDENRAYTFSVGMAEPRDEGKIKAGETGEKYHVFLFNKDEFEIYKKFKLEFGPFTSDNGEDMFKGRKAEFNLPR